MQKLLIEKFGPLENISLTLSDNLLVIGPQASGKSTISKAVFFFKYVRVEVLELFNELLVGIPFDKPLLDILSQRLVDKFHQIWGPLTTTGTIKISFTYKEKISIDIWTSANSNKLAIGFNPGFCDNFHNVLALIDAYKHLYQEQHSAFLSENQRIQQDASRKLTSQHVQLAVNEMFNDASEPIYVPAGRSLLAILSDQLLKIDRTRLDFLTWSYLERIDSIRQSFNHGIEGLRKAQTLSENNVPDKAFSLASTLIKGILKGNYKYVANEERIYVSEQDYIKLSFASSGQQEAIWMLNLIMLRILNQANTFLVIEEPEAHLYPEAQYDIVKLISLFSSSANNQFIVTTHSPYILSSFNNLLFAGKLSGQYKEIVSGTIPERLWINYNNFEAYFINQSQIRSIFDKDEHLIETHAIDSASVIINNEYERLYNIEISEER